MTDFKLGSHCLGKARSHFEEKFKDVRPGAMQLAFIEIGMEGFCIGMESKVELYEALEELTTVVVQKKGTFPARKRAISVLAKARGEDQ